MIVSVTRRGETDCGRKASRRDWRLAYALVLACGLAQAARAADYEGPAPEFIAPLPEGGVACSIGQPFWVPSGPTAETLPWPAVYYGHFSGGRPYIDVYGRTIIDWRDEHVCFPTSAQCRAWVHESYRTHHQPEGYRGCLLLR